MKKTIALLLVWLLCAGLACGALSEGIMILTEELHEAYELDSVALANLDATFPQLTGMADAACMERVNAAIRDHIKIVGEYDIICEYALDDLTNAPELFAQNVYAVEGKVRAELLRGDTLLAVRYDLLLETGGPHPWEVTAALHFDLSTGLAVGLETMTRDREALRILVVDKTLAWVDENEFDAFEEVTEYVWEWTFEDALLTREGLLVLFEEGALGPVYEGSVEILIPYEELTDLLDAG